MHIDDLVAAIAALTRADLERWIAEDLVSPREEAGVFVFSEMDSARVRLIATLHYELEVATDALPVVLSLVDELYETRQRLLSLTAAVTAQDEAVRTRIMAVLSPGLQP